MKVNILSKNGGITTVDLNRRKAIREKCLNCKAWCPQEVTKCYFTDCPLHPFRTGKGKQDSKARTRAIRAYCKWCTNGSIAECVVTHCPLYIFRKSGVDKTLNTDSTHEKHDIDRNSEEKREEPIELPPVFPKRRKSWPIPCRFQRNKAAGENP